jgi:hypothetical protein
LVRAQDTLRKFGALSPDDLALERARQTPQEILTEAAAIRQQIPHGRLASLARGLGWDWREADQSNT